MQNRIINLFIGKYEINFKTGYEYLKTVYSNDYYQEISCLKTDINGSLIMYSNNDTINFINNFKN